MVRDFRSGWTKAAWSPVLDKLDESNFTGNRMDCNPRANNFLFRGENGVLG
jgi:hypothetical protein